MVFSRIAPQVAAQTCPAPELLALLLLLLPAPPGLHPQAAPAADVAQAQLPAAQGGAVSLMSA